MNPADETKVEHKHEWEREADGAMRCRTCTVVIPAQSRTHMSYCLYGACGQAFEGNTSTVQLYCCKAHRKMARAGKRNKRQLRRMIRAL